MRMLQSIDSRLATLLLSCHPDRGSIGIARPDTFLSPTNINSMLLQRQRHRAVIACGCDYDADRRYRPFDQRDRQSTSITVAILLSIPPAAAMSPSQPLPLLSLLDSCSALVAVFSMGS